MEPVVRATRRESGRSKGILIDCCENKMRDCDEFSFTLASHFKIKPHRFRTEATDRNAYLQQVVQTRGAFEVTLEMHPRQPDLQLVEHYEIGRAWCREKE